MTKIIISCFLTLSAFFITSCIKKELNKLTEFTINYQTSLSIPTSSMAVSNPSATPSTVEFTTPFISTQYTEKLNEQHTAQSLVDKIVMTRFNLTAVSSGTTTANLDYLNSVVIYIKASGLSEKRVGQKTGIPDGVTTLALDLDDTDIKEFIFKDKIQFKVISVFDAATATNQTLKMDQTVNVTAKLIK